MSGFKMHYAIGTVIDRCCSVLGVRYSVLETSVNVGPVPISKCQAPNTDYNPYLCNPKLIILTTTYICLKE